MAKLDEKPDITICDWTAALYEERKRKWLYGSLLLTGSQVIFTITGDDGSKKSCFTIQYEDISEVRKSTTGLVFGAVYIVKKNKEKVWFSSLPDREGVYGALRHFTKQGLTKDVEGKSRTIKSQSKTEMGQKLLGIVDDSERTLNRAAVQLVEQGHQIDQAISTMADLQSDLDIVENLVDDLQSWVGRWTMPDDYQSIDPVFVNKSEIPDVFEYEVLYTKLQTGSANTKNLGDLRISKGGITILTSKRKTEHHFKWGDVSQLRVITPWEMIVIQNKIGEPDLKYSTISANMVAILKLLDKCARYKLKYDTPPDRVVCIKSNLPRERQTRQSHTQDFQPSFSGLKQPESPENKSFPLDFGVEIQVNQSKQVVTESEADEISRALIGLKSLAISVQKEESRQNERLDSLTDSADRANQRLAVNEKKIKKMI